MPQFLKKAIFITTLIAIVIFAYGGFDFEQIKLPESKINKVEALQEEPKVTEEENPEKIPLKKPMSILVLGADSVIPGKLNGWYGRSDFIAVVHLNPNQEKIHILSIPRDTKVNLRKHNVNRINSANQLGGYKFAKRAVQRLINMKIDHVFVFSIDAVIDMIDTLGKVKIFVPQKMYYNDNSANLHIDIKPGLQEMDGKQLMNFVRYRNKNRGDIARIERQQIFFRAALRKLKEPEMVFRLPQFLFKANKAFITDMDFSEMFQLGLLLRSLDLTDFDSHIVPGDFGSDGSWLVKKPQLQAMMKKIRSKKLND